VENSVAADHQQLQDSISRLERQLSEERARHEESAAVWERERRSLEDNLHKVLSENTRFSSELSYLSEKLTLVKGKHVIAEHMTIEPGRLEAENRRLQEELIAMRSELQSDVVNDLKERVMCAERKAEFLSSDRARSFALSSRVIAYLESECIRLKSLCDHYRSSNTKLSNDFCEMQNLLGDSSEIEYKYQRSLQNEQLLILKLQSADEALNSKSCEMRELVERLTTAERRLVNLDESNFAESNKKYDELLLSYNKLDTEYKKCQDSLKLKCVQFDEDVGTLRAETCQMENSFKIAQNKLKESDLENSNLKFKISELESIQADLEMRISLADEQFRANSAIHERVVKDLKIEIERKSLETTNLQRDIESFKAQLLLIESQCAHSGQQFSKNLLKLSEEIDENRSIREKLDEKTLLLDNAQKELSLTLAIVAGLKQKLERSEDDNKLALDHRTELENLLQSKIEELRIVDLSMVHLRGEVAQAKSDIEDIKILLEGTKEQLMKAQQENIVFKNAELQQRSMIQSLTDENAFLRSNLEALSSDTSRLKVQLLEIKSQAGDNDERFREYERMLIIEKQKSNSLVAQVEVLTKLNKHIEQLVRDTIPHVQSICDGLDVDSEFESLGISVLENSGPDSCLHVVDSVAKQIARWEPKFRNKLESIKGLSRDFDRLKIKEMELHLENCRLKEDLLVSKELTESVTKEFDRLREVSLEQEKKHDMERSKLLGELDEYGGIIQLQWDSLDHIVDDINRIVGPVVIVDNQLLGRLIRTQDYSVTAVSQKLSDYACYIQSSVNALLLKLQDVSEQLDGTRKDLQTAWEDNEQLVHGNRNCHEKSEKYQSALEQLQGKLEDVTQALETERSTSGEYTRQLDLLSRELEGTLRVNNELVQSIQDAEAFCQDLKSTVETLESRSKKWEETTNALMKENEGWKTKFRQVDGQVEKLYLANNRLKSEKDALENVRRSLEAEVDRCREDLVIHQRKEYDRTDLSAISFELEKLVSCIELLSQSVGLSCSPMEHEKKSGGSDGWVSLRSKIHHGISLVGQMGSQLRESGRRIKSLESDLSSSVLEVLQYKATVSELNKLVEEKDQLQRATLQMLDEKGTELSLMEEELQVIRSKFESIQLELQSKISDVDSLKEETLRYQSLVTRLTNDLDAINLDLDSRQSRVGELEGQLIYEKEQRNHVLSELESRKLQIESIHIQFEKALQSLQLSEVLLTEEKDKRKRCEESLKLLEGMPNKDVEKLKELISNQESTIRDLKSDLDGAKRLYLQREQELRCSNESVSKLNSTLHEYKEKLVKLHSERNVLEATCSSLQQELKLQDLSRSQIQTTVETLQKSLASERKQAIEISMSNRLQLESIVEQNSQELQSLKSRLREAHIQIETLTDCLVAKDSLVEQKEKQLGLVQSNLESLSHMDKETRSSVEKLKYELVSSKTLLNKVKEALKIVIMEFTIQCVFEENSSLDDQLIFVYIEAIRQALQGFWHEAHTSKTNLTKMQALQSEISTLRLQLHSTGQEIIPVENKISSRENEEKINHLLVQIKVLQESLRIETNTKNGALEEMKKLKKALEDAAHSNVAQVYPTRYVAFCCVILIAVLLNVNRRATKNPILLNLTI
jgi:chromosome segregation ATPase